MKNKFACGSDGIPSFLVHDCASVISQHLTSRFNLCLKTSTFPDIWRKSKMTRRFITLSKAARILHDSRATSARY
ncbi:unnamed protein product [Acanthoscelides obtectus]|uniref:Uncharacterized protein n=1 Tax=Acanthoscelides obtectus TaxID=200917 RepID=A0A9P0KX79_ACAOB|nr:unnamed protein product [Acanthoscelides obtectus]CAK1671014.1 hypothetical protein AOBTE_LOCUS27983 [Acanthoscelides obtectus]